MVWLDNVLSGEYLLAAAVSFFAVVSLVALVKLNAKVRQLEKSLYRISNEFRGMNSGYLGMGKEIKRIVKDVSQVEQTRAVSGDSDVTEKTYQQAGLLLSRGATIEEVVESCGIAPAEAELIAIMRHSAPSHDRNRFSSQVA